MAEKPVSSSETRTKWYERGQADVKEGRHMPGFTGPWDANIFETQEHYEERDKAYNEGVQNQRDNEKNGK